jgi:hypothetical protein
MTAHAGNPVLEELLLGIVIDVGFDGKPLVRPRVTLQTIAIAIGLPH